MTVCGDLFREAVCESSDGRRRAHRPTLHRFTLCSAFANPLSTAQEDFVAVLGRTKATVATRELARFEEFTKEFGFSGE